MNRDKTISERLNSALFGGIAGIFIPLMVLVVFYLVSAPDLSLPEFIRFFITRKKLSALISLSVLPDLLVFFIFIWLNYLYSARGVLAAVFLFSLVVVLTKFLI